ncbi:MAG: hypothetical protein Q8O22_04685 [Candidatus Omnitrophota bacterium]|nr:hypothetical protein [Candidatus Omnitrophota bacterium]
MAEEIKQAEKKNIMPTILKVILGIAFLLLGALAIKAWWLDLVSLIKGCIGLFLILAGVITLAIAKE